jgi:hypothetical protein
MAICPICKTRNTSQASSLYCFGTQEEQVAKTMNRYNELLELCNLSQESPYDKTNPIYIARQFPGGVSVPRINAPKPSNNYTILYFKNCADTTCEITSDRHKRATETD